jgi:hypothetical protein
VKITEIYGTITNQNNQNCIRDERCEWLQVNEILEGMADE